ncbi:MAG: hypothetical protein ACYC49_02460 [Ignavibacteriaceae bacterium]
MSNNTLAEIRMKGWEALVKELGYSGATKFILQFETGEGDYTKERQKFLKNVSLENILTEIKGKKRIKRNEKATIK